MESGKLKYSLLGAAIGLIAAIGIIVALVYWAGGVPIVPGFCFFGMLYGWIFYIFVRYRQARQEELLHVITASVAAMLPLASAVRAYLQDRPNGALHHFLIGLMLNIMVAPYFWFWYMLNRFDRRIGHLQEELTGGASLSQALAAVPAVANQETRIAATVGEATGELAACLKRADRERSTAAWLELLPRLIYPVLLVCLVFCTLVFFTTTSLPKYKKIFEDFKLPLPRATMYLISGWSFVLDHLLLFVAAIMAAVGMSIGVLVSPNFRWYFPIIGRLYRWDMQSLVLRSLGSILGMGRPVPEALTLLQTVDDLPEPAKRQLASAQRIVGNGEPLAVALHRTGLMPRSMVPLVQTAERTNTLAWTLTELGELRSGKALRVARRISILVAPLLVIAVGAMVGVVVAGIFLPLVNLIEGLSR